MSNLQYRTSDGKLLYVKSGTMDLGLARECCCSCPTGCPDVDGGVGSWTLTWPTTDPPGIPACWAGKVDPTHPLASGNITLVNVGDWQTYYGISPCVWWHTYNGTQNVLNSPGHWAVWFNYSKYSGATLSCFWNVRIFVNSYYTGTWPNQVHWPGCDFNGSISYWTSQDISTPKIVNVSQLGCSPAFPVTCTPGF